MAVDVLLTVPPLDSMITGIHTELLHVVMDVFHLFKKIKFTIIDHTFLWRSVTKYLHFPQ